MNAFIPGNFYHIYKHGNGEENLFREQENYRYFLLQYARYISPVPQTYAYCLVPDHFHLLIKVKEEAAFKDLTGFENPEGLTIDAERFISPQFSNLSNSYTKAFNKKYELASSLFLKNFKWKMINDKAYLLNAVFYVHLYLVKHQFVPQLEDWR